VERISDLCGGQEMRNLVVLVPSFQNLPAEPSGVDYRVGNPTLMNTFYTPQISLLEGIQRAFAG